MVARNDLDAAVPVVAAGTAIPRLIHQTYPTAELPAPLAENVAHIRALNPGWTYRFYDDAALAAYVAAHFGPAVSALLDRIAPDFAVARTDVFRYLLMYREGGVYLDIKSRPNRPFDEVLPKGYGVVTAQWGDVDGHAFGRHREIKELAGGEYQQWHIAAVPGHPIMRQVVLDVLGNIRNYTPWRFGIGKKGVLATTGPIAYSRAILAAPARDELFVAPSNAALGLDYSCVADHRLLFKRHYSRAEAPLVEPASAGERLALAVFRAARRAWLRYKGHAPAP